MKKEKFTDEMHPEAEHTYVVDFTDLLASIGTGTDTIDVGTTVTVVNPSPAPTGFTATFNSLDAGAKKVLFDAAVADVNQELEVYRSGGVTICIQVNIVTTSGSKEVQQVDLVVNDQCELA